MIVSCPTFGLIPNAQRSISLQHHQRICFWKSASAEAKIWPQWQRRPHHAFIGAEPFINGVASLVRHIDNQGLPNIRIWDDDVRLIMSAMPDGLLAGAYVLFPDPWPKKRHAARRILAPDVLGELARLIRPGGRLVLASDHSVAKGWLLQSAVTHPKFADCSSSTGLARATR